MYASKETKQGLMWAPPYRLSPLREESSILKPRALHNLREILKSAKRLVKHPGNDKKAHERQSVKAKYDNVFIANRQTQTNR